MSQESNEFNDIPSGTSEERERIPGNPLLDRFTKDGFKVLMEAIRHSNALPVGRDWNFYTLSDSFKKIINDEGSNVLRLMNQIMSCNDIESNIKNRILDEKTELVVEANDIILERVANNIDELNGVRRSLPEPIVLQTVSAQLPINGSWNRSTAATITVNPTILQSEGTNCIQLITAKNIIRPQKLFKDKIDNRNNYPWYPRITDKPNSLKPLAIFLEEDENGQEYSHPYEFELDRFAPTAEQLLEEIPEFPRDLSETPLVEIDKAEQLDELVETLRNCREFAVDVEHHSYRSFMGITCLLQISTKDKDYIIDPLALRDKLCILNEVFTKNNIVKIFHGATYDIQWLQRDLSLYVVNMFDTYEAAKVLQYPVRSLAFLMKKFCNRLPNKQIQLADWRIRPLPEQFKKYAREDTHYLIYIYKMLKKELLSKANHNDNLLKMVIAHSTEICKKRYFKPILGENSHLEIYRKCKKMFDNRQMFALKEIYAWRDNLAREEDESLGYVLPNHMMLQISESLPREMQGILACCNPIPPLVRSHLLELHQIVLKAREQPLEKAILQEHTSGRGVLKNVSKVNVDSTIHCPHDLSKTNEFRDDLPTLLNSNNLRIENRDVVDLNLSIEKSSSYSIFDSSISFDDDAFNERETFKRLRGFAFFSSYERYKLVKPFVVEEEKAIEAQKLEEEQNKEQAQDDNTKTDDERIASIRDHFIQLSKKFSEELEAKKAEEEKEKQKSLIEMGGSRKRKRHFESETDGLLSEPSLLEFSDNIDVIPRKSNNKNKRKKGRKRKHDEVNSSCNGEGHNDSHGQLEQPFKKRRRNRNSNQHKNQDQINQQEKEQSRFNQNYANLGFDGKQKNQQEKKQSRFNQNDVNKGNHGKQKGWVQGKQKKQKSHQNNSNFVPYDYASVDFRQFQGGAGSATSAVNIKSKFKPKNRRKMRNKEAKTSTFNNFSKDRGKGQGKG